MLTVVEYNHDDDKKRQPQNNHRLFGHCFHCLPTELLVLREVGELRKRFLQESLLDLQKSVVTCRRRPALWEIQMRRSTPNIHKHFQSSPCAKLESNIFQPWLEQLSQVISKQRAVCWHVFGHGHPLGLALWSLVLHSTWKICCISNPSQCSALSLNTITRSVARKSKFFPKNEPSLNFYQSLMTFYLWTPRQPEARGCWCAARLPRSCCPAWRAKTRWAPMDAMGW